MVDAGDEISVDGNAEEEEPLALGKRVRGEGGGEEINLDEARGDGDVEGLAKGEGGRRGR